MRVWGRQHYDEPAERGVARAAVAGVARPGLVQEAVQTVLASGYADRAGVWIASDHGAGDAGGFRGLVSDGNGDATPAEWARLSPEAPLPNELLLGKTVEQELEDAPDCPMVGALVEMRRALWVPIEDHGQLRGLLFAGTRKKHGALPRTLLESVAAELALALELEEQRRLARGRQGDVGTARRLLAALGNSEPADALLVHLVENCTEAGADGSGLGVVFAVIAQALGQAGSPSGTAIRAHLGGATGEDPGVRTAPCVWRTVAIPLAERGCRVDSRGRERTAGGHLAKSPRGAPRRRERAGRLLVAPRGGPRSGHPPGGCR